MLLTKIKFLLLFFLPFTLFAQDKQHFEFTIQSGFFDAERKIKVFVPELYNRDTANTFMVTYMLDAQDDQVWNLVTGNIDYLVSRHAIIPTIVVGIVSDKRGFEFSPDSKILTLHIKKEVFPLIEKSYRVKPFKVIVGHSWGGAFVGNTIFSDNRDMFDAYIGISPSFDAMDNVIYQQADALLKQKPILKKFFYFSSGNVGFDKEYFDTNFRMDSILSLYPNKSLVWKSVLFDDKDHFSTLAPALVDGLLSMSRNYTADQYRIEGFAKNQHISLRDQIVAFYADKQTVFGFTYKQSIKYLNTVADDLRDTKQYKAAIELYQMALEEEPDNVRIQCNLADTYQKAGLKAEAKSAFERSLELLESQKSTLRESYYLAKTKWAKEKLAEY